MDLSHLPEDIGMFIIEMMNDTIITSFLAVMLIVFVFTLLRTIYIGVKYPAQIHAITQEVEKIIKKIKDKDVLSIEIVKSLRSGDIKECFVRSKLSFQQKRLSDAMIGVDRKKYEIDYRVVKEILCPRDLISRLLPRSLSQTAPFLLTLGVIGTFLGLIIGVSRAGVGLASPDVSEARAAMAGLLDGAKLAFVTSLAGLVLATAIGIAIRTVRNRLVTAVEGLIMSLHESLGSDDWERDMKVDINNMSVNLSNTTLALAATQKTLDRLVELQEATVWELEHHNEKLGKLVASASQVEKSVMEFHDRAHTNHADSRNAAEQNRPVQEATNG